MKCLNPASVLRICTLILFLVFLSVLYPANGYAQCTGCTATVNNNGSAITANSGDVICIVTNGVFNKAITINSGGTVCISPQSTVTSSITVGNGAVLIINGTYTGSFTQNSGSTVTVNSGATFSPSGANFNGGSFNSAGNITFSSSVDISSNMTAWNSSGSLTTANFTNNGANVSITGGPVSMGNVTANNNSGSMTFGVAVTMTGFTANSGTTTFNGGVTINGSSTVNAAVNVNGNMTVTGNLTNNSGPITETGTSGCYTLSAGSVSGYGTINGGGNGFQITPSAGNYTLNSGAYSAPTQQPGSLSLSLSGTSISGSFTAPAAYITGYIVLRYVGTSAPSDNPVNGTSYSAGNTIGSSTVVAIIAGGSTGTKNFTDYITSSTCTKNAYYRIFSYSGYGSCSYIYNTTTPLTGNKALTSLYVSITPSGSTTFCSGSSINLTSTAGTSYAWSTGATSHVINVSTSGTYTVTVTAASCTGTASQVVTVNALPAPSVTSATICSGGSATLTAAGGSSYVWSTGATSASIGTSTAGTYRVTATSTSGCTAMASGTVTVSSSPSASISGTTSICSGSSTTLTASGGSAYIWSTGAGTAAISVNTAGTYIVTVSNAAGCSDTAVRIVTVNTLPTAAISGITNICAGSSTTLTASGGGTYAWSNGAGTASISVSSAATYRVTVSTTGCTATASSTVTVNALPTPAVTSATICSGSTATLASSGGSSYVWSTGATTTSTTASTAGIYTVTATNAAGCTATASGSVSLYTLPSVIVSATAPICAGSTLSLTATASGATSYSYAWAGPNNFAAGIADPSVANATTAASGSYTVTVTDNHSCTATASATASVSNCHSISGSVFDDANGDGIKTSGEPSTLRGNTLYGVLTDSATNRVLQVTSVGGNGAFTFSNIMPNTSGLRLIFSTTAPSVGATSPGYSWPSGWVGTRANYGANNASGTGIHTDTAQRLPVSIGTTDVTNILIGYDQLPTTTSHSYTVTKPSMNTSWKLNAVHGVGLLGGIDPEDGPLGVGSKFIVTSVAGMNGNKLYYDANGDAALASYEQITGYTVITSFDSSRLYMLFTGFASNSASFDYNTVDAAGKADPAPSVYNINWNIALPIQLVSFEAQKNSAGQIHLAWRTASEINNDYFEIERSKDAQHWNTIAEVKGAGTTNISQQYMALDKEPLTGISYYRLRQVDFDGQSDYSEIRAVETDGVPATTLTIYPNPVNAASSLNIVLAGGTEAIRYVRLTDQMGAVVYSSEVSDEQSYRIQGPGLPTGIYTVNIISDNGSRYSSKVTIQ